VTLVILQDPLQSESCYTSVICNIITCQRVIETSMKKIQARKKHQIHVTRFAYTYYWIFKHQFVLNHSNINVSCRGLRLIYKITFPYRVEMGECFVGPNRIANFPKVESSVESCDCSVRTRIVCIVFVDVYTTCLMFHRHWSW
jgi:hypothetical protein